MAHEYKHNNHALIINYPITTGMYKKIVYGLATRNPATYVYVTQIHTKFKTVVMPIGKNIPNNLNSITNLCFFGNLRSVRHLTLTQNLTSNIYKSSSKICLLISFLQLLLHLRRYDVNELSAVTVSNAVILLGSRRKWHEIIILGSRRKWSHVYRMI